MIIRNKFLHVKWKWIVLWSLWASRFVRQPTPLIDIDGNKMRGSISMDGTYKHYMSIPYATFVKRFQAAGPEPKWDGIRDLPEYNEIMRNTQFLTPFFIQGQEDSLVLNIYTPIADTNILLPVMVFFHGGGFKEGSASQILYGPSFLVRHDVILVTVNYRLGVLGFLCLGIKEAPGNVGMKDQTQALKWIKKNIEAFGGDSENILIFGESAGSASVNYHLLSPLSKGLFHKAILQSGTSTAPWAFQFDPIDLANAFAQQLGFDSRNPYELYNFLINKTDKELSNVRLPRKHGKMLILEPFFSPCAEKQIEGIDSFINDSPYILMEKGKFNSIAMIIGYNDQEGLLFLNNENEKTLQYKDISLSFPANLKFNSVEEKIELGHKIKKHYMDSNDIIKENILPFSKFVGDLAITYPLISSVEMFLRYIEKDVFVYKFTYDGWLNFAKLITTDYWNVKGAFHADELFYIFKTCISQPLFLLENTMVDLMSLMWTNFAKYGNPTPQNSKNIPFEWKPASCKDPTLLTIGSEFVTEKLYSENNFLLWNSTYNKYRRKV